MEPGLLIVFEGIDSSGKKTQVRLLERKLKRMGYDVETIRSPAYDTKFGKLVASYLRGEFGSLKEVPPEIAAMLFSLDRYQFKDEVFRKLREGKIILSDRYTQSNMGFHGAKFDGKERKDFIDWIGQVESRLAQPDLIILLDMPIEAAQTLINNRKKKKYLRGKKDIHEKDVEFQKKVRETYLQLARKKKWVRIKCADKVRGKWRIKTPEKIHEEILKFVERIL
jgi:dTMP kinase